MLLHFLCYNDYMFKKLLAAIFLLCLLLCGCGKKKAVYDDLSVIENRGKIIVGVREDTFPFGFRNKEGNLDGYDIDLAKYIALCLLGSEDKVEFIPVTAQNRISKLLSAEVDFLIATMSVTNQRQQILNFSKPYYIAGQAILVNSSSNYHTLGDFKGKKLIIVFGSTGEQNLRTNVPEVKVLGFKTYDDAFSALKQNIADGVAADDTILISYALRDKSVRLLPKRYSKEPYAVAFRKDKLSERLNTKIDYIIESMLSTGRLMKLQEKWGVKN